MFPLLIQETPELDLTVVLNFDIIMTNKNESNIL